MTEEAIFKTTEEMHWSNPVAQDIGEPCMEGPRGPSPIGTVMVFCEELDGQAAFRRYDWWYYPLPCKEYRAQGKLCRLRLKRCLANLEPTNAEARKLLMQWKLRMPMNSC